jgi:sugar phosphate isomerase/epimerase
MPIRSCVTISLVPEAKSGPFVFHGDLVEACRAASDLGFDAVEVFPPAPDAVAPAPLHRLLADGNLALAAVGTGAGWLRTKLTLVNADAAARAKAIEFIRAMIDFAGEFQAPAIIGSMQGRAVEGLDHATALGQLSDALEDLGEHAKQYGVPLLYEPLNRYETNLANTMEAGLKILGSLSTQNVLLLADLFHMNIEEPDIAAAILTGANKIGHVHFVDSNRRPAGLGHLDFAPISRALQSIGYEGFASAEALPFPDAATAARLTIDAFRAVFR